MKYLVILFLFFGLHAFPQNDAGGAKKDLIDKLLDSLWINPTSFFNKSDTNWRLLCDNLQHIDRERLDNITASIYSGLAIKIGNESASSDGILGSLNHNSHVKRMKKFNKKMADGFADKNLFPDNKIVLVEGDSWFEYPLFLNDITDYLMEQENLAIYSLASGGDWAANIVSGGEYQDVYLRVKPDVFIMSGGGNDLLENEGIKKMISEKPINKNAPFLNDYRAYVVLRQNNKPVPMCTASFCPIAYHRYEDDLSGFISNVDTMTLAKIVNGRRYINKNFYRFLVSFKLEYKILFESIRKMDPLHFDSLKIITQGYDYAIPNTGQSFGIRMFIQNGIWLKKPLESLGITDQYTQESIVMALIFDFNEMLIELGKEYNNIYHVDVRGFTRYLEVYYDKKPGSLWYDELHPTHQVFDKIAGIYAAIINGNTPENNRVFSSIGYFIGQTK